MISSTEPHINLQQLYDSAFTYAIYTVDLDGKVTSWSVGAEKAFGFSAAEMIGQDSKVVFTPEDRAARQHEIEITTAITKGCSSDYR